MANTKKLECTMTVIVPELRRQLILVASALVASALLILVITEVLGYASVWTIEVHRTLYPIIGNSIAWFLWVTLAFAVSAMVGSFIVVSPFAMLNATRSPSFGWATGIMTVAIMWVGLPLSAPDWEFGPITLAKVTNGLINLSRVVEGMWLILFAGAGAAVGRKLATKKRGATFMFVVLLLFGIANILRAAWALYLTTTGEFSKNYADLRADLIPTPGDRALDLLFCMGILVLVLVWAAAVSGTPLASTAWGRIVRALAGSRS
jgi:hypothetical protein